MITRILIQGELVTAPIDIYTCMKQTESLRSCGEPWQSRVY